MSFYQENPVEAYDRMIGRVIASVSVDADKERVRFRFTDGASQVFRVEGDCCSRSWIEHVEVPRDVAGATILAVEDSDSVDVTDDDSKNPRREPMWDGDDGREHECLQVYSTSFRTNRGEIVLEYRNSSNGYYGGYLVDEGAGAEVCQ